MTILYQARASAIGGRTGRTATDDGALDVTLAMPPELGGAGGEGANPEQLFACGYAACFLGAIRLVAKRRKVRIHSGPRADDQRKHPPGHHAQVFEGLLLFVQDHAAPH